MDADELTRRREALGMNQSELARRLGVPRNTVWRWEHGYRIAWPDMLALALRGLEQERKDAGDTSTADS